MADNSSSTSSFLLPTNGERPNLYIATDCPTYAKKMRAMEASEVLCEDVSSDKESQEFFEDSFRVNDSIVGEFDALVEEDFMDERIYGVIDHNELLCLENLDGEGGLEVDSDEENHRFLPINPKEVQNVETGGCRRSKHSQTWARKAFDAWRRYKTYDTSQSIEDLSETDVKSLVNLLHDFMLQVAKKIGSYILHEGTIHSYTSDSSIIVIYRLFLFEALALTVLVISRVSNFILFDMLYCSLQGLLRALGRIIRSRIASNAVASRTSVESFYILKDPRYAKVKLAADEAALRSIAAGLGKDVKRSDILTIAEEKLMLSQEKCQINSPHGINLLFGYFCTRNFMIRGGQELRNTDAEDFSLHSDNYGEYIPYKQGTSKNWKFDIVHCSVKDF